MIKNKDDWNFYLFKTLVPVVNGKRYFRCAIAKKPMGTTNINATLFLDDEDKFVLAPSDYDGLVAGNLILLE
jgi:hypothetical protein